MLQRAACASAQTSMQCPVTVLAPVWLVVAGGHDHRPLFASSARLCWRHVAKLVAGLHCWAPLHLSRVAMVAALPLQ